MAATEELQVGNTHIIIDDSACGDIDPKAVEETLARIVCNARAALASAGERGEESAK